MVEDKTDKQLYKEFLKGNNDSFEKLVIRHKDKLIYFITTYVKNIDIAEDIAQDVFVYILIHKTNYDFHYSLKTYLYTIAKSKAINFLKREKKISYTDDMQMLENMHLSYEKQLHDLEEIIFRKEQIQELHKTILKLKPEYSQAIYLADIEEMQYKEIGKVMKKSLGNTKVLIHRARKALDKLIREESEIYEG